jgi:hypothetical protein
MVVVYNIRNTDVDHRHHIKMGSLLSQQEKVKRENAHLDDEVFCMLDTSIFPPLKEFVI